MKKVAVVLFNLGGPDKPESVKPFLFNLFNDKAIIGAPNPIRWGLAKFISTRRAPFAREIYEHLGGKSPLLELTQAQATALEEKLNQIEVVEQESGQETASAMSPRERQSIVSPAGRAGTKIKYKAFICMRYWHPMSAESVAQVKEWGADEAILLPLYPQFSTTTTGSSFHDWEREAKRQKLELPTARIGCYPTEPEFIEAHAALLKAEIAKMAEQTEQTPRILFSAHGLPQKIVDAGDPYQWQVEQGVKAIVEALGDPDLDYVGCFQSKVGPFKWLEPSTETEIERAAKEQKPIIIVPIAFVSEHSETLVELDIEYKELAEEHGLTHYGRVPALGVQPHYIECLASLCHKAVKQNTISHTGSRLCPAEFGKCVCREVF